MYWLEIFKSVLDENYDEIKPLHSEGNEILSIIVTSINTAKRNRNKI